MEDKFGLLFMVYCLWKVVVRLEALQSLHEIFGKRVGMELSCRIAKKNWKNSKAPTAVGWMPCGSLHFRDFERSIVRSITQKLCIVH